MRTEEYTSYDEEEFINVGLIFRDYFRVLKRTWLLLIVLVSICIGGLYLYNGSRFQEPSYNATIYYSVESVPNLDINKVIAKRLANGISSMIATNDFRAEICKELGLIEMNARFWCNAKATDSSNLFQVTLSCTDSNLINKLMKAFETVYPAWVIKSIGNSKLVVTDEAESIGINYSLWSKKKILAYGLAAAAFLWFMMATLYVITHRRIHNQAEMYQVIDAECLGTMPEVKKKRRRKSKRSPLLISNKNVDTGYLQSVRTCRDLLERDMRRGKKVFMFTSTMPAEGKTLLTVNLAYALAHRGKTVAVVDGDIYRAGINSLLDIPAKTEGLTDFLCSEKKNQIGIYKKDSLYIIPVGTRRESVQNHMNSKNMQQFIESMKEHVDVILIDTPPAGMFGDALVFTEAVDEIIYVIRGDYAAVKDIKKGIQPFFQSQKLGGYILNRIVEAVHDNQGRYGYGYSRYRYGYSGYHRYGYHYGDDKTKEPENQIPESDGPGEEATIEL